jgi:hypothetical protein
MRKPVPAVKVAAFEVEIPPSKRSPLRVAVKFPLLGDALVPCAELVASSEFE